jgi:hypothetical protein
MTHTTLSVEGIDVLIEGDGPQTLLMLHGWPDTPPVVGCNGGRAQGTTPLRAPDPAGF